MGGFREVICPFWEVIRVGSTDRWVDQVGGYFVWLGSLGGSGKKVG